MIRSLYWTHEGTLRTDLTPAALSQALSEPGGLLWVDLSAEPAESAEPILRDVFRFHPLAVDDALEEVHVPKVDDWADYIYLVLHAVVLDEACDELVDTLELDVFLGRNYLVTYQSRPLAAVERAWDAVPRLERYVKRGTAYLFYFLADEVVADYMPVIEALDEAIDEVEDRIFRDPEPALLERIFTLKRALLRLRRIVAPQREVLNKLGRGDFAVVATEDRIYFRDVYDHLVRLYDISENLRDLVGSALDTYLSVVNNRMNEVMKTLTVITTLFMPISFLAGFFGMNFFQPSVSRAGWMSSPVFVAVVLATVLLPVGMYLWMRSRAWS